MDYTLRTFIDYLSTTPPPPFHSTNIQSMCEYSNPQLSKDEAGYYLTTLEAAAFFIERLTPAQLKAPQK